MKKIIAMIPARMASTRYPGKPLIDICGRSMLEHVWQRVRLNSKIDRIYVATCDEEIKLSAEKFGAHVIMTSDKHERCTDRIAEASEKLYKSGDQYDIVVNIQGDEPLLNPEAIDLLVEPFFNDDKVKCVNLIEKLVEESDINDPNNVKAIFDQNHNALYFSRLPIPNGSDFPHFKQLGVYALTKQMALQYSKMEQTPLEIAESDDMLRFVENGIQVKVVLSPYETIGVDTIQDHEKAIHLMKNDPIYLRYK